MRIAIIADAIDRNNAGISQYIRQLIMNLKKNHELTVIHLRKSIDHVYAGVKELIIPKFFHRPGMSRIYINIFLRSLDVDIIHHPSTIGSYIVPPKQPLVQTVYDIIPMKLPHTRTFLNRLMYEVFFKPAVRNAEAIITISNHSKKDICSLLRINPNKIFVTPLASQHAKPSSVEMKRALIEYKISYPYFLFVGTLEPRKNIVRMLEAFAQSGLKSHHFVLVGSLGWKYDEIFRTISRLKLNDRVHVLSGVPNSYLPGLYAGASALLFASLYEGFGLPVLEAMSCGCPVITGRNSSLPEVAGDAALYVDPFNVEEIAGAMRAILKKRAFFIRKGFIQAKKFSWNKTAEQTVRVYEKVLER
jgi:glycosyltransferase involved in cell wall biosynthesis